MPEPLILWMTWLLCTTPDGGEPPTAAASNSVTVQVVQSVAAPPSVSMEARPKTSQSSPPSQCKEPEPGQPSRTNPPSNKPPFDLRSDPRELLETPNPDALVIEGLVGLQDFRSQFALIAAGRSSTVRFSHPVLTRHKGGDASQDSGEAECATQKSGSPCWLVKPTVQIRVGSGRTLKPGVPELFEVEALNVSEEGTYNGTIDVYLSEETTPKHIKVLVRAYQPRNFELSGSQGERRVTRCSACWLKDLLPLPNETLGPEQILVTFNTKDLLRYTELLKVHIGPRAQQGDSSPSNYPVPTVEALDWPKLWRQGSETFLHMRINPNALPAGHYEGVVRLLLPDGKLMTQPPKEEWPLIIVVREGPGVLLGLVLAGALLYLLSEAAVSRGSLLERLKGQVRAVLMEGNNEGQGVFSSETVPRAYTMDIERLGERYRALETGPQAHPERHFRHAFNHLYRLALTIRHLRQIQDDLSREQAPYPKEQGGRAAAIIGDTCQSLRNETDPNLVPQSIEALHRHVAQLEKEARASLLGEDKRPTELSFVVSRLQLLEKSTHAAMRHLPVPWLSVSFKNIVSFVVRLLLVMAAAVFAYSNWPTFGTHPLDFVLPPPAVALSMYVLVWLYWAWKKCLSWLQRLWERLLQTLWMQRLLKWMGNWMNPPKQEAPASPPEPPNG